MKIEQLKSKIFPEHGNIHVRKRVKFGIDPTGARLHLGHLVPLLVVKDLIAQRKEITIVLGTFTATLGDPSGVNQTRPVLPFSQVQVNSFAIKSQIEKILGKVHFVDNHKIANSMNAAAFISDVIARFTVQELMARENFQDRTVALHELIVPLMQAMDSIVLDTEIEVGGVDQEINFGLTRKLQQGFGKPPEVCLLTPIINGTDGKKMSKSLNNCIFLDEPKEEFRQKVLKTADTTVDEWIKLLVRRSEAPDDPRDRKEFFVEEITKVCRI